MADTAKIVEETWAIAYAIDGVTDKFYERLFQIRPDFKTTLFGHTNLKTQSKMLASTIDFAVKNLRDTDVLVPALQDLGMRHCSYGIRPEHYAPVGEALLWTLEFYFKEKFTKEVRAAWTNVYTTIQTVMASQCDTAEGKRRLAAYEAKYPSPKPVVDTAKIVEETWAIAYAIDGVTDKFYERLFTIRPDFKTTLFGHTNLKTQSKMLASTIDFAVKNLRDTDVLVPALQDLGMRHCSYGIRPEHYAPVGEALLWTLEFYFKEKFTKEVRAAWTNVYTTIQTVMASQCDTAEGKRRLAEYEAKYPTPKPAVRFNWKMALVAIPAALIVGQYLLHK